MAATRSGARKAASSTTRQPMLWPTKTAGGRQSACTKAATSLPPRAMLAGSVGGGVAPWPGKSTATVIFRGEKCSICASQSLELQPKPCTKTIGGNPLPETRWWIRAINLTSFNLDPWLPKRRGAFVSDQRKYAL